MNGAADKKFILHVGTQKTGTSWLYDYFRSRGDVRLGPKECDILNHWTLPRYRRSWKSELPTPQLYVDFFADKLARRGVLATGDFTPEYAALSVRTLSFIKREFEKRGVEVAPIFIMRDPVDRLRSMASMLLTADKERASKERVLLGMRRLCRSPLDKTYSDYATTISNLEAVFGEAYIGFYEDLFTEESLRSLCEFVGLDYIPGEFKTRHHWSEYSGDIGETERAYFRRAYAEQYQFVVARFGADRVAKLWDEAACDVSAGDGRLRVPPQTLSQTLSQTKSSRRGVFAFSRVRAAGKEIFKRGLTVWRKYSWVKQPHRRLGLILRRMLSHLRDGLRVNERHRRFWHETPPSMPSHWVGTCSVCGASDLFLRQAQNAECVRCHSLEWDRMVIATLMARAQNALGLRGEAPGKMAVVQAHTISALHQMIPVPWRRLVLLESMTRCLREESGEWEVHESRHPPPPGSVDIVWAASRLKEAYEWLKPGGRLVVLETKASDCKALREQADALFKSRIEWTPSESDVLEFALFPGSKAHIFAK